MREVPAHFRTPEGDGHADGSPKSTSTGRGDDADREYIRRACPTTPTEEPFAHPSHREESRLRLLSIFTVLQSTTGGPETHSGHHGGALFHVRRGEYGR